MFDGPSNEDFKKYNYGLERKHAYGNFVSTIPWERRIIDETERDELEKGLERYFYNNFNISKEGAAKKANDVLTGQNTARSLNPTLNEKNRLKALRNAVSLSEIENFILDEPWHFEMFMDPEKPTTFPFQHSTVIAYTAQNKFMFFQKEAKQKLNKFEWHDGEEGVHYQSSGSDSSPFKNPQSVLNQGFMKLGNRHSEGSKGSRRDAIFFGDLSVIRENYIRQVDRVAKSHDLYENRSVFEIAIPSNRLKLIVDRGETGKLTGEYHQDMKNISDLKKKFSTPRELRKYIENNRFPGLEFAMDVQPGLPLNLITGAWDPKFSSEPYFIPFSDRNRKSYVDFLRAEFGSKIPDNPKKVVENYRESKLNGGKLKEELKIDQKIENEFEILEEILSQVSYSEDQLDELISKTEWFFENIDSENISNLDKYLDEIVYSSNADPDKSCSNYKEFNYFVTYMIGRNVSRLIEITSKKEYYKPKNPSELIESLKKQKKKLNLLKSNLRETLKSLRKEHSVIQEGLNENNQDNSITRLKDVNRSIIQKVGSEIEEFKLINPDNVEKIFRSASAR